MSSREADAELLRASSGLEGEWLSEEQAEKNARDRAIPLAKILFMVPPRNLFEIGKK